MKILFFHKSLPPCIWAGVGENFFFSSFYNRVSTLSLYLLKSLFRFLRRNEKKKKSSIQMKKFFLLFFRFTEFEFVSLPLLPPLLRKPFFLDKISQLNYIDFSVIKLSNSFFFFLFLPRQISTKVELDWNER